MDLVALKAELDADPSRLGYAGKADGTVAELLNKRDITVGDIITGAQLWGAISLADHRALSNGDERIVNALCAASEIDLSITHIRGKLRGANGIFSAGSTTADRINAYVRKISRGAEAGLGNVSGVDVAAARKLP